MVFTLEVAAMTMDTDESGRKIILKSLEPGGEPWLVLSYEEGLKELDDFWPSPELKPASPAAIPAVVDQAQGEASVAMIDDFDGLMEDLDEIAQLEDTNSTFNDGEDTIMKDDGGTLAETANDTLMEDAFDLDSRIAPIDATPPATSAAASVGAPEEDSPIAAHVSSPQLPTLQHSKTSTPSPSRMKGRGSTMVPSSELRSSMQKEMHAEDKAAVDTAREDILPDIPLLTGLGHTGTLANGDDFKSLEQSASILTETQAAKPANASQDVAEAGPTLPFLSATVHQRGRKHDRSPTPSPSKERIGSDAKKPSSPRPLAKKPRRRGRTTSQSELQVDNEAVLDETNAEHDQETNEDPEGTNQQSGALINTDQDDSSLTDLTLDLQPGTPPEPATTEGASSELPSGQSWDFGALGNPSRPPSEKGDAMEVDEDTDAEIPSGEVKDDTVQEASTTKSRKDSLMDAKLSVEPEVDTDVESEESSIPKTAASPPTKPKRALRSMRAQTVLTTAPAPASGQTTLQSRTNSLGPQKKPARANSRLVPTQKPQSREVAALIGVAGLVGAGVSKTSVPRKTRNQKAAEEPNPSQAAKKRHSAVVDYSKML